MTEDRGQGGAADSDLPAPRSKRPRLSREEKTQATLQRLMEAGARVIGAEGYAAASVAKIAAEADVAQGTFYNYFASRQEMFDVLLPYVGRRMLDAIATAVDDAPAGPAREEARFRAFCDYLARNPGFYRILYEAEVFAPKAHAEHVSRIVEGYRRALDRSVERGEIEGYDPQELEAIIYILLGARAYLAMAYTRSGTGKVPEHVIRAYSRLIRQGLFTPKDQTAR